MDIVFKNQIEFILKRGTGIKACLFDEESKQIISNLIPYSVFLDNDFFYFDYISNKKRTPLSDISCIIFLRPTSLKLLIEELVKPFYKNYIVLFTNQIDPFALEIIANADVSASISEIHEVYLDMCRQDKFLYTIGSANYSRAVDGLYSLLASLEINPSIKIYSNPGSNTGNNDFFELGRELIAKASQYNFQKKGALVMLKRSFDPLTPLVYDWHYQAMIQEHLNPVNGIVRLDDKDYSLHDHFYASNRFKDINSVGTEIQKLVRELERNKIKISNHEFEDIEEKAAHSLMVEKHLKMYKSIIDESIPKKENSEREMGLIKNGSGLSGGEIEEILMFFIKNNVNWEEESKKYPKLRDSILKFKESFIGFDFPYKPTFDSSVDIKLSYESPLKRLLRHIHGNKLRVGALKGLTDDILNPDPIIIYIEGGVTMIEYRDAMKCSQMLNVDIYLVSDKIITRSGSIKSIKTNTLK